MNESRLNYMELEEAHIKVKSLACGYFEQAETAEKYIFNYQDLKMNTDIPLHKRRQMHSQMLEQIRGADTRGVQYKECIPGANEAIKTFVGKASKT